MCHVFYTPQYRDEVVRVESLYGNYNSLTCSPSSLKLRVLPFKLLLSCSKYTPKYSYKSSHSLQPQDHYIQHIPRAGSVPQRVHHFACT